MGSIYKITNTVNGKIYIGQTRHDVKRTRIKHHLNGKGNKPLFDDIQKYGVENFDFTILHDGIIPELLDNYEQVEIEQHACVSPNGYNLTRGGSGNPASPETCRKISRSVRKTFAENPQIWREAQKNATEAAAKHNTGREYSESHRQAISNANKGKIRSNPVHNKSAIWNNTEEIVRLYTQEKLTCPAIAVMYGLAKSSASSVRKLLKANGVNLSRSRKPKICDIWNHQDEVIRLYTADSKTTNEIGGIFKVCSKTVLKVLKSNSVKLRKSIYN